ncbi:MAG: DUF262 domain-containing protein [Clostridia bacterium]|nr:DUF262 domain-containing protein [Clostridia bacterium]
MSKCIPELWTLKEIYQSLSKGYNGDKKIVIPMFQRGKRWSSKQQESFIESLKKSYPIGTLLFYKTTKNDQQIYTLIDGLQRGTAIKKYLSNPTHFFKIEQIPADVLSSIYALTEAPAEEYADIDAIIMEYVHQLASFDTFEIAELFTELADKYPIVGAKLKQFTALVKPVFQSIKDEYNDLSRSQIPAIVYSGEEETLADIFTLMNSQGTPLTDYEIYAASWPSQKFHVSNDAIVDYVLKKYDCLNDDGYEVHGYDRDAIRKSKNLSAFEYVFGLSKYITTKYPILAFQTNLSADETNPVAFLLLNACFNSSHNRVKDVYSSVLLYKDKIDVLESCLIKAIEFVDSAIAPIIRFKGNTRHTIKIMHSQFQILSMISFTFREMFDADLEEKDSWKNSAVTLKDNFWKYYVYDILSKHWAEGGTTKIHSANGDKRYLSPLTRGMFSTAFDNYVEYCNNIEEAKNVHNPNEKDYVILNTIYLSLFTAMDQLSLDAFDVEHIATKSQMKGLIKKCKGTGLPISHIANICYLPEGINRTKQDLNFYQDTGYLAKAKCTLQYIEEKYSFTEVTMLEWMDLPYQAGDFATLREEYFEYLQARCITIKQKFLTALGFSADDTTAITPVAEAAVSLETFTDDFFRLEKIGIVAKKSIEYLVTQGLLTDDDFEHLKSKDYSMEHLGCAFPLFVYSEDEVTDDVGQKRYWTTPIHYNGQALYVCSQWFEHDRKRLVPWVKKRLVRT